MLSCEGSEVMKKLTLLGDSIRLIGYGRYVPELLKGEYEVFQPSDNCRFSKYTLRGVLHEWRGDIEGSDIIHWNNGHWDHCDLGDGPFSSLEEYKANMVRVAKQLLSLGKVVIFATTTPVCKEEAKKNAAIIEYNEFIVPILRDMGIVINDLHAFVNPHIDEYICDDRIHLTEEGARACARQIVSAIRDAEKLL